MRLPSAPRAVSNRMLAGRRAKKRAALPRPLFSISRYMQVSGGLKSEALTPVIVVVALVETEPLAYVKVQVLLGGVPVRVQNPVIVSVAVAVPAALVVQGEFTETLPPPAQTPVIVAFGTGL